MWIFGDQDLQSILIFLIQRLSASDQVQDGPAGLKVPQHVEADQQECDGSCRSLENLPERAEAVGGPAGLDLLSSELHSTIWMSQRL